MGPYPRDDVDETVAVPETRAERRDRATADTRASILAAARTTPARRRLRQPLDPRRRRRRRGPAQPDPLPLRQQAAAHPRGPRGRERAPPRAPAHDVRRARAAVAPVGAGVRLPRGGPRAPATSACSRRWSRPAGPTPRSRRRFASSSAAGTGCWPRSRSRVAGAAAAASGRSRRSEVAALMGLPFLGAESVILLGFPESVLPARSALRKLGGRHPDAGGAVTWRRATVTAVPPRRAREQTRARYPDETGFVERDGVRVFWERYGDGSPTILLMPTWTIVHSRHWKVQIPYLARHFRVVMFDGRGNGRSDRPSGPRGLRGHRVRGRRARRARRDRHRSGGGRRACRWAPGSRCGSRSRTPERVLGLVPVRLDRAQLDRARRRPRGRRRRRASRSPEPDDDGWHKYNAPYWRRDWPGVRRLVRRRADLLRAALDQAGRGHGRLDPRDRSRDDDRRRSGRRTSSSRPTGSAGPADRGPRPRVRCATCAARPSSSTAPTTTSSRSRTGRRLAAELGAPMVEVEGGGHSADRARARAREPADPRLRAAPAGRRR